MQTFVSWLCISSQFYELYSEIPRVFLSGEKIREAGYFSKVSIYLISLLFRRNDWSIRKVSFVIFLSISVRISSLLSYKQECAGDCVWVLICLLHVWIFIRILLLWTFFGVFAFLIDRRADKLGCVSVSQWHAALPRGTGEVERCTSCGGAGSSLRGFMSWHTRGQPLRHPHPRRGERAPLLNLH